MLFVGRNVRQAKRRKTYDRDLLSVANNVHFIDIVVVLLIVEWM